MEQQKPETIGQLLRHVLVFQFKLAMDSLRDVLLSPISITATVIGIVLDPNDPAKYFNRLLDWGHRSDRWINLFSTYSEGDDPTSDDFVRKAESIVLSELEKSRQGSDTSRKP